MTRAKTLLVLTSLGLPLLCAGWSNCKDKPSDGGGTAGSDSAKPAADVHLPGIDTSALTPRERREFSEEVTTLIAPCPDVPVPIAQCILENRPCVRCKTAAKYVLLAVRGGRSPEEVEHGYKQRFESDVAKKLPLEGSPTRGPASAPVTLVEFADFECPACAAMSPALDKVLEDRKDKVRLTYKIVCLNIHTHAEPAARAAVAAGAQGKFWEMHHLLFANQQHLERTDLEHYARQLGLDMNRFRDDMDAEATRARIEQDKKLENEVKLDHTPTLFMNGRQVDPIEDLEDWLSDELGPLPPNPATDAGPGLADAGKPDAKR